MRGYFLSVALAMTSGCAVVAPAPTPPDGGIEIMMALGFQAPNRPPATGIAKLDDGSALALLDDDARGQELVHLRWDGTEWRVTSRLHGDFLVRGAEMTVARVLITETQGFPEDMLLVLGQIPNGPINQLELEVDGEVAKHWIDKPATLLIFDADAVIGDEYRAFDAGTHVLDEGSFED